MTSSPHGLYVQGYTRATMAGTNRHQPMENPGSWLEEKAVLSSDYSLQLDCMKLESLVIAYQNAASEYVPGPCPHRPSHHESGVH